MVSAAKFTCSASPMSAALEHLVRIHMRDDRKRAVRRIGGLEAVQSVAVDRCVVRRLYDAIVVTGAESLRAPIDVDDAVAVSEQRVDVGADLVMGIDGVGVGHE